MASTRGGCARAALGAALAAGVLLAPAPARAQRLPATVEAFDVAFRDWMRRTGIGQGVIAVGHDRRPVLMRGYGGLDPAAPVPLASLSKAITGACAATLIRDGRLSLGTRLGDVLAPFFRRQGAPADARVGTITVGQLLTHRSGFSRKANPDPASGVALVAHLRAYGAKPAIGAAMARAMAYRLARPPGQAYEYVNVNYLILGAVIEATSGRPYEAYCRDAVLRPAGVTNGRLGPKWGGLSAYGGWSLSGPDYLAFLNGFERSSGLVDAATWRWMLSPAGKRLEGAPHAHYALGVVVQREREGPTFTHTGLWTHAQKDAAGGPLAGSLATLAVKAGDGASWFVYVSPQPSHAARAALHKALWRAHDAVRLWPAAPLVRAPNVRAAARLGSPRAVAQNPSK